MIVVAHSTSTSPSHEVEHHALQLVLVHLAVADGEPRLGHELAQLLGHAASMSCDAVVDEEDLAAAVQLAQRCACAHQLVVVEARRCVSIGRRSWRRRVEVR